MTAFTRTGAAGAQDAAKLSALRRTKLVATAALVGCVVIFVVARSLQGRWPWLSFVAAFFEAATIGGLADWYAVVALFRHPLGLPIPHTAIIPENQHRIADNLGGFIEANFLAPGPIRTKLREVDFAAEVANWLSDHRRAAGLSAFVVRLTPQMLVALGESGLRGFAADRVMDQLKQIKVAPLAAGFLELLTENRRHQRILDEMMRVLGSFLSNEDTLNLMRDRIRSQLPRLFNLFQADAYLLKKIVASTAGLLDEVRKDPDHALRLEFDSFVASFLERLRQSEDYARRAEQLKLDLLARPELRGLADDIWRSISTYLEQDAASDDSMLRTQLATAFVEVGRQLARDERIRADMNQGFVIALAHFVDSQKSGVARFIADQVKRWDLSQLTRLIELNIGRDLQYIRFNGMLVGGLAGLALHVFERLLFAD